GRRSPVDPGGILVWASVRIEAAEVEHACAVFGKRGDDDCPSAAQAAPRSHGGFPRIENAAVGVAAITVAHEVPRTRPQFRPSLGVQDPPSEDVNGFAALLV